MNIIPVIDILNNHVVTALKGDRYDYQKINTQLYNTTEPIRIISQIINKYSPKTIYIADLDAIITNQVNHLVLREILKKFPKVDFWIDSGLNTVNLDKSYKNYVPIFCSEKAKKFGFSEKNKSHVCSIDYKNGIIGPKSFYKCIKEFPKKVIIMDLSRVGTKLKPNFHIIKKFIKKKYKNEYYVAGGIRSMLDIKFAKLLGAQGVLVSSLLHMNKVRKFSFLKERANRT
ncbi:MAG: HisA/HisF-related TIM barrel protein [Pseudomonadota bacterium]|nr:HisA/HisF-related TIM barrel protein [Pseudomonadota bacterium]